MVFFGDSITDSGRDRDDPGSLGDGYVQQVAAELADRGDPARVTNVGISGNRAVDLAARWDADVEPLLPDVLTIFVGVNDTWRRFDQGLLTPADAFAQTCRGLVARARAVGVGRLVIMEPYLLPVTDEQFGWLDDLAGKRAALREIAAEAGAQFIGLHGILTAAAETAGAAALAPDGVHPSRAAVDLIARSWLRCHDQPGLTILDY
ncbi:SGNH/GDSL hydrolase family protein [Tessaracoccus terricola]